MPKDIKQTIKESCSDIDSAFMSEHLSRLSDEYFSAFPEAELLTHVHELSNLSNEKPISILCRETASGEVQCTVLAFDYPGEFSLIAGILTGAGFNILSGNVFTYSKASFEKTSGGRRRKKYTPAELLLRKRRIIDVFCGTLDHGVDFSLWVETVREQFTTVIGLLEKGGDESTVKAKHTVNEMVAGRLEELDIDTDRVLYPVQITIDNDTEAWTRLTVTSQDTPGFLYALSTALALRGILIESVNILTEDSRIEDEFAFTDSSGKKIVNDALLNQIQLSVLLTKQFTYFLGSAPDPYAALSRFEQMVSDVLKMPEQGQWVEFLSVPDILGNLARLLGASDFMWEDFIRLQYESLLPMLEGGLNTSRLLEPAETLGRRISELLAPAETYGEKKKLINEFKDREIFLIDLDHILNPDCDLDVLSHRLTSLAEHIVNASVDIVSEKLIKKHGYPRTVAGLENPLAVLGLGKFGGGALGYASDIELLFVYSDSGKTDGENPIDNGEFYNNLVLELNRFIEAKTQGIFNIDLRLRPFGNDGPQACSLESFCRYYGKGGGAHSYERLALVRLRAIGGDLELGAQIERIRDEIIYSSSAIDLEELRELREKQFRSKTGPGKLNAKFSPGALVDLEYDVQILQVMHGMDMPGLRTPRLRKALTNLEENRVLKADESQRLSRAYYFLRRLINGLRMLRGSARDLFMPETDSDEYMHLARRMGYAKKNEMSPAQQLHLDFETQTAIVRAFVEHHFGRDSLPGPSVGSVADLVLSYSVPKELRNEILKRAGFGDPARAYVNIRNLSEDENTRDSFARLVLLAFDILVRKADPDMALNNWERFIRRLEEVGEHYTKLLSQPRRIDLLMGIFSGSQFLSDTLIHDPDCLDWVTDPAVLHRDFTKSELLEKLTEISQNCREETVWLNEVRRFRHREMLRIGVRDLCLSVDTVSVVSDLSILAEAIIQAAVARSWEGVGKVPGVRCQVSGEEGEESLKREKGIGEGEKKEEVQRTGDLRDGFCILALGKLGGEELNYSSDIDLLGLFDNEREEEAEIFRSVMENTVQSLSKHTDSGYVYRVDLRLRPYGSSGSIVHSTAGMQKYFRETAAPWEIQALLKARPVAGNLSLGEKFLSSVSDLLSSPKTLDEVARSIDSMRNKTIKKQTLRFAKGIDIKVGKGGIRDIEFLVQGLQLASASSDPSVLTGNTLEGILRLGTGGILPKDTAETLRRDYLFLRRVEHLLQIYEDRQIHVVPEDPELLTPLAKRLEGLESDGIQLKQEIEATIIRVRKNYEKYLLQKP